MTELADLLTGAAARHALAHRDITAVFRILRDAGVSQTRLAHTTGQQQSEISEIISGRQVQSVALLERIADGLGVSRGCMGLAYDPELEPEPAPPGDAMADEKSNANLLRHAATVLLGAPVFGPAAPIHVKDAPTPVPRRIGLADLEQVASTTERLRQLAHDLGGIPLTEALTAHAQASEALLGADMPESVRQRLLVELADTHRAAGSAASGAGLPHLARQHLVRGMDCAGAAGDLLRAAFALDGLGRLELDDGRPNEALKFFQLGTATASCPLVRAKLEYDSGWALGLLGLAADALAALRRARDSFQAVNDVARPWRHFATTMPHIEGCTYLALGRFDSAVTAFAAAAAGARHAVGCTTLNSGLLAAAQLRCGELGAGLVTAGRVIGMAKGLRSVSVRENLAPLQEAAAARRDSACQDLARELATLRSAA
ncbi:MAG: helix-turn-helix domain-containing protein [Pseudonocardiaceae bacterium]